MKPIRNTPVKKFFDLVNANKSGYPKTIYDDGETKFQVWNSGSSSLVLLIKNSIIPIDAELLSEIWHCGERRVSFHPPSEMNSQISGILQCYTFDSREHFLETDEFLMVSLEDEIAIDIGDQFDEDGVAYAKDIYEQFRKDWAVEVDEMDKKYYRDTTTRPMHSNIAILQDRLNKLESEIEAVEVNENDGDSYEKAVETLSDKDGYYFEEINYLMGEIPDEGGPKEEADAISEIERRIKELKQKMRDKLDEIGYEDPED
jgi:hypothetical protein